MYKFGIDFLRSIEKDKIKLETKEEELKTIESTLYTKSATLSERVQTSSINSEKALINLIDLKEKHKKNCIKYNVKVQKAVELISLIEEQEYQKILNYKYLRFMKWIEICKIMKYSESWVFKKHAEAKDAFEKVYSKIQ